MILELLDFALNNLGPILIGLVTFLAIRHVQMIRRLPPGPFPLPILGNLLLFLLAKDSGSIFKDLRKKYGNIFTIRFGSLPFVIISDTELAKEALLVKKNDFSGRIKIFITNLAIREGSDIAFMDYSPGWSILKNLGHTAVRKYVANYKMPEIVYETTDQIVEQMLEKKSASFDPQELLYLLIFSLADTSSFGRKMVKGDNKDFLELKAINAENKAIVGNGYPVDFLPFLRPFYLKTERSLTRCMDRQAKLISDRFEERKRTYQKGEIRDFSDALIASREEAIKEDSNSAQFMTDINLKLVVTDLFAGGVDTQSGTLEWSIRYLAKYQEVQEKMYNEIKDIIGDRMAVQEDRLNTPYIWAVLFEVLRLRTAAPFGLPHTTMVDTEISGHKIPKDTPVLFNYDAMNKNPTTWREPEEFRPERFLDSDGKFTKDRLVNYVPFGLGRRFCVGEKLAKANLYLILVRLLQRVKFIADGEIDLIPLDKVITFEAKPCKVFAEART